MRLDFNFSIKNLRGQQTGIEAKNAILDIFDMSSTSDDTYHDKKRDWAKDIDKTGQIETDATDAKRMVSWITSSPGTFDFVKIALKQYIRGRVEASEAKTNGQQKKQNVKT